MTGTQIQGRDDTGQGIPNGVPHGDVRDAIESMVMIGPFFLMAYYQIKDGQFTGASCTCGWILETPNGQTHIEAPEFIRLCAIHNKHHNKYVMTLDTYKAEKISYQTARTMLMYDGMEEQRADDLLDEMRFKPHG